MNLHTGLCTDFICSFALDLLCTLQCVTTSKMRVPFSFLPSFPMVHATAWVHTCTYQSSPLGTLGYYEEVTLSWCDDVGKQTEHLMWSNWKALHGNRAFLIAAATLWNPQTQEIRLMFKHTCFLSKDSRLSCFKHCFQWIDISLFWHCY